MGTGEPSTNLRVKVRICGVSVVRWITQAPAPPLEADDGKNKMFRTDLDDFSGGAVQT